MATSDLIRLATELDEAGGMHRLTSLINCAVKRCLEHERSGEETGVGMSDKASGDICAEFMIRGTPTAFNPASIRAERLPLPVADCQDEHPRGITHAPDSPLLRCQDDFGRRRRVPRYPEEWR